MDQQELERLKYPIGKFKVTDPIEVDQINDWIIEIESFPAAIENLTSNLSNSLLNKPYRPDGWTVKQVVHHCADSHMNALTRFKLSLTEDTPTIKPYMEHLWAELTDSKDDDISYSLKLIEGIHYRWVNLLSSMSETDFKKSFAHPESGRSYALDFTTGMYAWHGNHHLGHIRQALES